MNSGRIPNGGGGYVTDCYILHAYVYIRHCFYVCVVTVTCTRGHPAHLYDHVISSI